MRNTVYQFSCSFPTIFYFPLPKARSVSIICPFPQIRTCISAQIPVDRTLIIWFWGFAGLSFHFSSSRSASITRCPFGVVRSAFSIARSIGRYYWRCWSSISAGSQLAETGISSNWPAVDVADARSFGLKSAVSMETYGRIQLTSWLSLYVVWQSKLDFELGCYCCILGNSSFN